MKNYLMDNKDFIIYNLEKKFKKINLYKDYKNAWKLKYIFYKDDLKSFIYDIKEYDSNKINNISSTPIIAHIKIEKKLINFEDYLTKKGIIIINKYKDSILIKYNKYLINLEFIGRIKRESIFFEEIKIYLILINIKIKKLFNKIYKKFNFISFFSFFKFRINFYTWQFLKILKLNYYANKFRYTTVEKDEFLQLRFKDSNILNNLLRKKHFDLITNNDNLKTIKDIIFYYSDKKIFENTILKIKQPNPIKLNNIPRHLDRKFWNNGNSFFFNCLICGFRKEIKSYEKIDSSDLLEKNIYSLNYYKSKPVMSRKDIEKLLSKNPIQIRNGSISSGRHRVSAMIGRLIRGEEYIPFYKDKFIN